MFIMPGSTPDDDSMTLTDGPMSSTPALDESEAVLILRPPSGLAALNLRDIWQFRGLLGTLAVRDLKLRYKQTALGVIWVVLQPILAAGIFSVIFGIIAKIPSENGVPYFLFAFCGQLAWNLFNTILTRSSVCLTGNTNLISKVFFPRLVLPMSTIGAAMVDFVVAAAMMAFIMAVCHVHPGIGLLLLPVWILGFLMLSLGVGLFAAALTVSYRDVQYILPVALNLLMWASPIGFSATYAIEHLPHKLRFMFYLNPLTGLFEAFRWSTLNTTPPSPRSVVYAMAFCGIALLLGAKAFKQMERKFADVI
jgi:lipopolysaccharide transport system permease protein